MSDIALRPLINLLRDPIRGFEFYPDALQPIFQGLEMRVLSLSPVKLGHWIDPYHAVELDFFELTCNEQLYGADGWRYDRIVGLTQLDSDHCLLIVDLQAKSISLLVTASTVEFSRFFSPNASPLAAENSRHFQELCRTLANWFGAHTNTEFHFELAELRCQLVQDPLLILLGQALHDLFPRLDFNSDRFTVADELDKIAFLDAPEIAEEEDPPLSHPEAMLQGLQVKVIRPIPLGERVDRQINICLDTSFEIPAKVLALIDKHRDVLTKNYKNTFLALLFFASEPLLMGEAASLARALGLKTRPFAGNHPSAFREGVIKTEQTLHSVYGSDGRMKHRGTSAQVIAGINEAEKLFSRTVVGVSSTQSYNLHTLTELGRQEMLRILGQKLAIVRPVSASLSKPNDLVCLLLHTHGPLTFEELYVHWEALKTEKLSDFEKLKSTRGAAHGAIASALFKGLIVAEDVTTDSHTTIKRYSLASDDIVVITPPPLPDLIELSLEPPVIENAESPETEQVRAQLLAFFDRQMMGTFEDCMWVITGCNVTTDLLKTVLDSLVAKKQLFYFKDADTDQHCYIAAHGAETLEFEHFYHALNSTLMLDSQKNNFALSRHDAMNAFHSKKVYNNLELLTSRTLITAPDEPNPAVQIRLNEAPLEFLGRGLFACVDLPAFTLIPVVGKETLDAELPPDLFLPYGFKYETPSGPMVIDTNPEGTVTCWAGFVNDPRKTGFGPNAVIWQSPFEPAVFLRLSRAVSAGEQLFWDYGEEYPMSEANPQQSVFVERTHPSPTVPENDFASTWDLIEQAVPPLDQYETN